MKSLNERENIGDGERDTCARTSNNSRHGFVVACSHREEGMDAKTALPSTPLLKWTAPCNFRLASMTENVFVMIHTKNTMR